MSDTEEDKNPPPPPTPKSKVAEYYEGLSALEKTELLQLLQGAKPKGATGGVTDTDVKSDNLATASSVKTEQSEANTDSGEPLRRNDGGDNDAQDISDARVLDERKIPKLPSFSGSGDTSKAQPSFRVWKFECDDLRGMFGEREVKRAIHRSVSGNAAKVLMRLGTNATVSQILNKFELIFGSVGNTEHLLAEFYTSQQKTSETVADWACRLEDTLCHPQLSSLSATQKNEMLKTKFFHGLVHEQIRNALRHRLADGTYDELLILARQAEEEQSVKKVVSKVQTTDPVLAKMEELQKSLLELTGKVKQIEEKVRQPGPPRKAPTQAASNDQASSSQPACNLRCYYCKQLGHVKRNCPQLLNKLSSAARSDR